jgi:hypothetical protein
MMDIIHTILFFISFLLTIYHLYRNEYDMVLLLLIFNYCLTSSIGHQNIEHKLDKIEKLLEKND